jgi:1-acyl-sn-glycerol-3-phosphate acyltransferase
VSLPIGRIARSSARLLVRLYYPVVEITGRERIPASGAVLFCANHPNSMLDPAFVGLVARRPVHFFAKAPLFDVPVFGAVMRALGMVPAYRGADDKSQVKQNLASLEAGAAWLARGEAVGIFPEGKSHDLARVEQVRTGAARLALQAAKSGVAVTLVPLGLNYERKERFRSAVWVNVGEPLDANAALREHAGDDRKAMRQLTAELDRRLKQVAVHLDEAKWEPFLEHLETLTAISPDEPGRADLPVGPDARQRVPTGVMSPTRNLGNDEAQHGLEDTTVGTHQDKEADWQIRNPKSEIRNQNRLITSGAAIADWPIERIRQRKRIADAMNHFLATDRPCAESVAAAIEEHRCHLTAAGLDFRAEISRQQGAGWLAQVSQETLWLVVGFVPALAGLLHHFVPFVLTRLASRLFRQPIRATIALSRLGPGLVIFVAWYALVWWWLARWFPNWLAWIWTALMPPAGIQALHYWPRAGQAARVLWQRIRISRRPGELERLQAERAALSGRLRAMAEELAAAQPKTSHEPGRADLRAGVDAQQRVPTSIEIPVRDSGIIEPPHEP